MHAQRPSGVTDIQEFSRRHRSQTIAVDGVLVEYVDFSDSVPSASDPSFEREEHRQSRQVEREALLAEFPRHRRRCTP